MSIETALSKIAKELQANIFLVNKAKDNHGNTFNAWLESTPKGMILFLKEASGRTGGKWSWYLSSLNGEDKWSSKIADRLYLDMGQNWYVTGMLKILEEAQKHNKKASVKIANKWNNIPQMMKDLELMEDQIEDWAEMAEPEIAEARLHPGVKNASDDAIKSLRNVVFFLNKLQRSTKTATTKTAYDPSIQEAFTADISKKLLGLRSKYGIASIRQNYKGTGSRKATRQLWIRLDNGEGVDVWLEPDFYQIGGVTINRIKGNFPYSGRTSIQIAEEIASTLQKAFGSKKEGT